MVEKGAVTLLGKKPVRANVIDTTDLADFILLHLPDTNVTYDVGGTETYTYEEMANMFFAAAGKEPVIKSAPPVLFDILARANKLKEERQGARFLRFSKWTLTEDMVAEHQYGKKSFKAIHSERTIKNTGRWDRAMGWEYLWILLIICAVLCAVGFYKFVYFLSIGYGFAIAGGAVAVAVMFRQNLSVVTAVQLLLFLLYGARLSGFLLAREIKNGNYRKTLAEATTQEKTMPVFVKAAIWVVVALLYTAQLSPVFVSAL